MSYDQMVNRKSMHRVSKIATLSTVIAAAFVVGAGCAADPREPSTAIQASESTPETDVVTNTTKTPEPNKPEPNKPEPKPAALSHPVGSADALVKWFDENAGGSSRATFRIPVVIVLGGLGIERAFVGTGLDGAGSPLEVKLDDSALGISLHDRIRQIKNSGSVAIWIEGQWGPLLSGMPTQSDKHTIAVRKVGEPIESADSNAQVTLIH